MFFSVFNLWLCHLMYFSDVIINLKEVQLRYYVFFCHTFMVLLVFDIKASTLVYSGHAHYSIVVNITV